MIALLGAVMACATAAKANASVDLIVVPDKPAYAANEAIGIAIEAVNRTADPVTLQFRTAQRYEVIVVDAQGREAWRWPTDQMFAQVLGEETLGGRGRLRYRVAIRRGLPPGRYTVAASVPAEGQPLSGRAEITVR